MNTNSGLLVSIYEDKQIGNCSANGISARYKQLYLVSTDVL